jgi:uncharacterized membrane protein YtjA (UPF0391 family)
MLVLACSTSSLKVQPNLLWRAAMLRLAILFLVVALVAAFLGFGGVASLSFEGAKIFFVIFLVLAVLSLVGYGYYGRGSASGY